MARGARGDQGGSALSPVPTMVASTLPELLDDAAAWRFAQAGVPAVAGIRTGLVCAAALGAAPAIRSGCARSRPCARPARDRPAWLAEHEAKAALRGAAWPPSRPAVVGRGGGAGGVRAPRWPCGAEAVLARGAAQERTACGRAGLTRRTPCLPPSGASRRWTARLLVERMAAPGVELLVAARRTPWCRRSCSRWEACGQSCSTTWRSSRCPPAGSHRAGAALPARRPAPHGRPRPGAARHRGRRTARARHGRGAARPRSAELIELNPVIVHEHGATAVDADGAASRARVSERRRRAARVAGAGAWSGRAARAAPRCGPRRPARRRQDACRRRTGRGRPPVWRSRTARARGA